MKVKPLIFNDAMISFFGSSPPLKEALELPQRCTEIHFPKKHKPLADGSHREGCIFGNVPIVAASAFGQPVPVAHQVPMDVQAMHVILNEQQGGPVFFQSETA